MSEYNNHCSRIEEYTETNYQVMAKPWSLASNGKQVIVHDSKIFQEKWLSPIIERKVCR